MTPDGRFIAFIGNTNIVTPKYPSILVWDGQSGSTILASPDRNNNIPVNATFAWPTIDSTGRFVAFLSSATNLVTNSLSGDFHLYVRDIQAGSTALVDSDTNGVGVTLNTAPVPSLSADGRYVAFESPDTKLVPRDSNRSLDVFVRDISSNATELVSSRAAALPSNAPNAPNTLSLFSVSSDGRYVAFSTETDNLIANDTNGCRDIVVRDLFLLECASRKRGVPQCSHELNVTLTGNPAFRSFSIICLPFIGGLSFLPMGVRRASIFSSFSVEALRECADMALSMSSSFAAFVMSIPLNLTQRDRIFYFLLHLFHACRPSAQDRRAVYWLQSPNLCPDISS